MDFYNVFVDGAEGSDEDDEQIIVHAPFTPGPSSDCDEEVDDVVNDDDEAPAPKKRRRGKGKEYALHKVYDNYDEAVLAMQELNENWVQSGIKEHFDGDKVFFKCKTVRGAGCRAALYLLKHADSQHTSIFICDDHNHAIPETRQRLGIPQATKEAIHEIFESGRNTPLLIMRALRDKGIAEPRTRQLENYLTTYRKRRIRGNNKRYSFSLAHLQQYCIEHSIVPENDDTVFVGAYELDYDASLPEDKRITLRIFWTTKRLLRLALNGTTHVCCDSTYKLVWQLYPIMMVRLLFFLLAVS